MMGVLVPANIFVYATSDTNYVAKVSSTMNIEKMEKLTDTSKNINSDINSNVVTDIAEVLGMRVGDSNTYSLVFGEELADFGIVYKYKEDENVTENFDELTELTTAELSKYSVVEVKDQKIEEEKVRKAVEQERKKREKEERKRKKAEEKARKEAEEAARLEAEAKANQFSITHVDQSGVLLEISEPDPNYTGAVITLSPEDRDLLERLVMGEAGGEGMNGAALVAQAIRDTMVYKGFSSVEDIRVQLAYQGHIDTAPNQNVKDAVAYIFDKGGCAVKHQVFYFYAPARVSSAFHETQRFVIEYGGHKFFSNW